MSSRRSTLIKNEKKTAVSAGDTYVLVVSAERPTLRVFNLSPISLESRPDFDGLEKEGLSWLNVI